jgi:hypothetical protein
MQDVDILFIEDMTNSSVLDSFKDLMCDIAVNDPHVLLCSRTTSTDLTLGATLRQRVTYTVHAPATAAQQIHYASDENRSVSGVEADDESKYLNWAYVVQEALDKYIFDTYGKMASIGLLHYPDIAEIALNDLTPAEKEFCMRECDSDDDEMFNQDLLGVCTMTTRSSSSRQPSDDEPRKPKKKQKSRSMTSSTTVKLPPPPVKYFVEIGAGSATMTCDWLDANPSGIGLCIDIMDPIEFWPQIPLHLRPRVRYHRSTTNEDLDETQVHKLLRHSEQQPGTQGTAEGERFSSAIKDSTWSLCLHPFDATANCNELRTGVSDLDRAMQTSSQNHHARGDTSTVA